MPGPAARILAMGGPSGREPTARGLARRDCLCCGLAGLAAAAWPGRAGAAEPAAAPSPALVADLVAANHILFDQAVVDGFGHVSVRHDKQPDRFLLSRSMAPALVQAPDIMEFELDGAPVAAAGRTPYLERFIHGAIYRARPDVMAVVHSHSPGIIPFGVAGGAALRPVFHLAGFLGPETPVFEIRDVAGPATDLLVRSDALGDALARSLGSHAVVLMRGHGSTTVGTDVRQAVFRAVYAEINARLQSDAGRLGPVTFLNTEEAAAAAQTGNGLVGRAWELWRMRSP